uniref:Uncharacterized protein n=1 Tax=Nicotiana tabacum TaxID=4097 RepID=A0A1S3XWT3_TOBAC|nr:PREDICTED: uncharacterized protein LOC107769610 [Nicotiana tabacum]XP_016444329.1 PREDICTED: uncharacterized protein LOC107769610 [Nicotiana tabacum]
MIFIDEKMWCVVCAELETWRLLARGGKKGASILLLISEVSFATSYASKIYVNLNVDYIISLIQKFATMSAGVQTIERSNVNNIPIEEEMFLNRMNIKELLDYDWSPELEGKSLLGDEKEPEERQSKRLIKKRTKQAADVSLDNLEHSGKDQHVNDVVKNRKRRNIIIDDDEFSDGDTNICKQKSL